MTRDEALAELSQPTYDPVQQQQDKLYVAKKLGFSDEEFDRVLRLPNRSHEEFASEDVWRQRYFRTMAAARPVTRVLKKFLRRP